jgi:hypothetical protein
MGEFMGDSGDNHMADNITTGGEVAGAEANTEAGTEAEIPGYQTDVDNCRSDDVVKQGKDEFPCFDVTADEFHQNMQDGRRRLRWKSGSEAQKYMSGTKYNRPFFVRHTDSDGKKFVRKIK